jgi:hypothetical protein
MSDHAELMTLGICHRLPLDAEGSDRRSDSPSSQRLEVEHMSGRVVGMHVEVHAILAALGFGNRLQNQDRPRRLILKRRKDPVPIGAVDQLVTERSFPEGDQRVGVMAVEDD